MEIFNKLGYPRGLVVRLKGRAERIMERTSVETEAKATTYFVVPNSKFALTIDPYLSKTNICIAHTPGRRMGDILKHKKSKYVNKDSVVYEIPCSSCNKSYIGESGKGYSTRLKQHKADVRHHRTSNAIVMHIDEKGHLPNWNKGEYYMIV